MKGPTMTPTSASTARRSSVSRPLIVVLAIGSALALAGCSAAATTTASTDTSASTTDQAALPGGGGVSGTIAAASDSVLQVQDAESQTAVSYTADTVIQSQVAGTFADVTVGSCVFVMSGGGAASDTATAAAATSITVTATVDGECTGGGGFGGGGFGAGGAGGTPPDGAPSGLPTDLPSGVPTDLPDGAGGGFGGFTTGLVTAVSGTTITVDAIALGDDASTTESTDVTVDDATTYTTTVDADASALVVGQCVAAQGESDDSGGLAATSLTVSTPGDDGCTTRPGAGGPGGFGQPQDGSN